MIVKPGFARQINTKINLNKPDTAFCIRISLRKNKQNQIALIKEEYKSY